MNKKILIAVTGFLLPAFSFACDICGCGVGGTYIGILPDFSSKIFGIRYRYNGMLTHIGEGNTTSYLTSNETYKTIEAWGGWNITPKIRVMAALPLSFNERSSQAGTHSKTGLGDASATAWYRIVDSPRTVSENRLLVQSLWAGAGIKLPSGQYDPSDKSNTSQNANLFQLGTKSVDYTLHVMYDVRLQDLGLNLTGNYKINTTNKFGYAYGNKWNMSAQAYYKVRIAKALSLAPNAGLVNETSAEDIDGGFPVDISGGKLLMGSIGLEVVYKKFSIGTNWQTPFSQDLANGFVRANNRGMVHVSIIL